MTTVNYNPPLTIRDFLTSNAFIRAIMGPFGSGKSVGCVMALLQWAKEQAPSDDGIRYTRFVIVRNTNRMLEDTTIRTVHEWVPPGQAGVWLSTKRNYTIKFGDVQTEWWFRALDTPEDVKNLLSLEVTGAWLNEYREIHPDVLVNIIGRVGRYRGPGKSKPSRAGIIMDSNPPAMDSYYYKLFEEELSEEMQVLETRIGTESGRKLRQLFKQPSGLGPHAENVENLPDHYYELMVANNKHRGDEWAKVHVHGEYGMLMDGEPVYHGFNPEVHVAKQSLKPIMGRPLSIGMDFGLTPAACIVQQNAKGQWMVLGELVTENTTMGIERFIERLLPYLRQRFPECDQYEVWADPAGQQRSQSDEKTCFQSLKAAGFTVRPGPQDLTTRIGSVQRTLSRMIDGQPGVIYDPSCKLLLRGKMGAYRYRRKQTRHEELVETPDKADICSHVTDAEQYVLGAFEGPAMRGKAPRKWGGGGMTAPIKTKSWRVF
jgi:hypothetical protein